jgi:hypothetical protein
VIATAFADIGMYRMRYQDAPDLFERTLKEITQHRAILHALERASQFRGRTTHLHFHCDKSSKAVFQDKIDFISCR